MSKFGEDIQKRQERKQDRKLCKRELGKFCYDLAKITYTALVIGCVIPIMTDSYHSDEYIIAACMGAVATIIFAVFGYKFNSFNK